VGWCAQVGRLGKKVGKFKKGCRLDDNGDRSADEKQFDIGVWGGSAGRMEGRKERNKLKNEPTARFAFCVHPFICTITFGTKQQPSTFCSQHTQQQNMLRKFMIGGW
jgi:hypothetical protein